LNAICPEAGGGEFDDIVVAADARPVLREHAPAERVDLAEGDRLVSGGFEPKGKPSYAAEQVQKAHSQTPHAVTSKQLRFVERP
jgi:hypothetical protein